MVGRMMHATERFSAVGTDGLFFLYDAVKDEVIADGQRREAAMQQIALLEKLVRETAKARIVGLALVRLCAIRKLNRVHFGNRSLAVRT
jgi:hypothetical protein